MQTEPRNRAERRAAEQGKPMTAAELADHYGVTRVTIYNLLKRGMPSFKVGRCRRFRLAETDAWLDEFQQAA